MNTNPLTLSCSCGKGPLRSELTRRSAMVKTRISWLVLALFAGMLAATSSRAADPLRFERVSRSGDESVAVEFTGPVPWSYILEASVDLKAWSPLTTNTAWENPIVLFDRSARRFERRFYRARMTDTFLIISNPEPKVVYGDDDRIDVYQETDPGRRQMAASTCALLQGNRLRTNSGVISIVTAPYRVSGRAACSDEPYGNQPTAAFCTGFLVGPDLIATAGHCFDSSDIRHAMFVFGFDMANANQAVTTLLPSQIYTGIQVVGRAQGGGEDYCIIRVDRTVSAPGATPLALRRSGTVPRGTRLGVIGHPSGLPTKLAFGAATQVIDETPAGFFNANLDTYGGNSGSPVFNAADGVVEGILVNGERDFNIDVVNNCFRSNRLLDSQGHEGVSKATTFTQFVPDIPSSGILYVDANYRWTFPWEVPNGSATRPYPTIAQAHQAARDGDVIRIRSNTYPGAIQLTKRVRLEAEGGAVFIGS